MAHQRLKEAAEKAKKELSSAMTTNVNLPFITVTADGPLHMNMDITRAKFEQLTAHLVERTMEPMRKAMADAGVSNADIDKVILVGGSTRIPAVQEAVKRVTGKEPFKGINPDECVAAGAAIQAGVLTGEVNDILLLDVTPLSLSIETLGGVATRLIERNTTIPTKRSQIFSTAADNQTAVDIHVMQGEREMAAGNITLGRFQLTGIAPAPRGIPQIEVTFDIDANGIVHVSAKDNGTGKVQDVTITASSNLSEEDIQQAIKDAERFAEEDNKRKEIVDARNQVDMLVFQIEKFLGENGDKVDEADKTKLNEAMTKAKEDMKSDDIEVVKKAQEDLSKVSNEVFSKLYQQAQANPENGAPNDDNVVDAEEV
jgi:molecular chaperone DnaK